MTQAKPRFATFAEYLSYSEDLEGRFLLIEGALVELPPESPENDFFALNLRDLLIRVMSSRLARVHTCEVQVPVLQPKDAANRFPDLVVLRPEHLDLMQRRLTITLDMPPPQLIAEVVSPGRTNRDRDFINKRVQYAAIGVPEYWLIDPSERAITVLELQGDEYREIGIFKNGDPCGICEAARIVSPAFPALALTAEQVFQG
jgi:Uma2 family endonuclease